uniref:Zinc finger protein 573 n=1 Tax=Mandrillus leucophaeus TaxID=9568 RepID=A0A2K6AGB1_MANLE
MFPVLEPHRVGLIRSYSSKTMTCEDIPFLNRLWWTYWSKEKSPG